MRSPRLAELLGPARKSEHELTQRYKDIARSVQGMHEEALDCFLRTKMDVLVLGEWVVQRG